MQCTGAVKHEVKRRGRRLKGRLVAERSQGQHSAECFAALKRAGVRVALRGLGVHPEHTDGVAAGGAEQGLKSSKRRGAAASDDDHPGDCLSTQLRG